MDKVYKDWEYNPITDKIKMFGKWRKPKRTLDGSIANNQRRDGAPYPPLIEPTDPRERARDWDDFRNAYLDGKDH